MIPPETCIEKNRGGMLSSCCCVELTCLLMLQCLRCVQFVCCVTIVLSRLLPCEIERPSNIVRRILQRAMRKHIVEEQLQREERGGNATKRRREQQHACMGSELHARHDTARSRSNADEALLDRPRCLGAPRTSPLDRCSAIRQPHLELPFPHTLFHRHSNCDCLLCRRGGCLSATKPVCSLHTATRGEKG